MGSPSDAALSCPWPATTHNDPVISSSHAPLGCSCQGQSNAHSGENPLTSPSSLRLPSSESSGILLAIWAEKRPLSSTGPAPKLGGGVRNVRLRATRRTFPFRVRFERSCPHQQPLTAGWRFRGMTGRPFKGWRYWRQASQPLVQADWFGSRFAGSACRGRRLTDITPVESTDLSGRNRYLYPSSGREAARLTATLDCFLVP
jgi:hypothetical protein